MGVDIYGINPAVTSEKPVEINWDTTTDEEKKAYFEAYNKWEDENPGMYFRSNWWGWRPIILLSMMAQREYNIPVKINEWDANDGDGLKSPEECNLLADGLERFVTERMEIVLHEDDDRVQVCMGAWVTLDGKFLKEETEEELNNTFPQGTLLFTPIVMSDGLMVESAHSTPLWLIKKWITFLRNCGGFQIF